VLVKGIGRTFTFHWSIPTGNCPVVNRKFAWLRAISSIIPTRVLPPSPSHPQAILLNHLFNHLTVRLEFPSITYMPCFSPTRFLNYCPPYPLRSSYGIIIPLAVTSSQSEFHVERFSHSAQHHFQLTPFSTVPPPFSLLGP